MTNKILIPLDGSERSETILQHLSGLLTTMNAQVALLGIVDTPEHPDYETVHYLEQVTQRATAYLNGVVEGLRAKGLVATMEIQHGNAAARILDAADDHKVDMIALASHGHKGFSRWLYGSTAERVIRASKVPVLVVRGEGDEPRDDGKPLKAKPFTWKHVVVPLDGSRNAESALELAVPIARAHDATLHLVRAIPVPAPSAFVFVPEGVGNSSDGERRYLELLSERLIGEGLKVETHLAFASPVDYIKGLVEGMDADPLLVMTTHGRTGLNRWVLGSVAEDLLRRVSVPVLLTRNPDK